MLQAPDPSRSQNLNWTGGEPPVAVALKVMGVPTVVGNVTLEARLVI
jgi:hypothetical protein